MIGIIIFLFDLLKSVLCGTTHV